VYLSFFQHNPLALIWALFGVLWLLPAAFGKRTIQRQTSGARIFQLSLLVAAYVLFAHSDLGWELLNRPLVPGGKATTAIGYGLLLSGMLFACWARIFLGSNWSANVTLKEDHALVSSGPYRIVRHPIYTGLLVALLGTAIALGPLRCFLGVVLAAAAWKIKSMTEEAFMLQQFGDRYMRYRMQVKSLVPYIW
jgi:protein-S-isoprenylcysteine O-methyltransferase Ste14